LSADGGFRPDIDGILGHSRVDGMSAPSGRGGPDVGSNPVFYSLPPLKIPSLPIERLLLRCGQKIGLTFVSKNGMNIPQMEFYGLFVPFLM
jgi:hypothetical protein